MLGDLSEQAKLADQLGYDSINFTEHHFHIEGLELSTNPVLLDLFIGMQTKRLRVGQLGIVLLACTAVALALANSPLAGGFAGVWKTPVSLSLGAFTLAGDVGHLIVNDGLMTLFFFVVDQVLQDVNDTSHVESLTKRKPFQRRLLKPGVDSGFLSGHDRGPGDDARGAQGERRIPERLCGHQDEALEQRGKCFIRSRLRELPFLAQRARTRWSGSTAGLGNEKPNIHSDDQFHQPVHRSSECWI